MKLNSILSSLVLGATLTTGSLFANAVKITDTNNDGDLSGGEFLVTTSQDNLFSTTGDNRSFLSFCLENGTPIAEGVKYTYTIELAAKRPAAADVLSVGSAWLYESFFKGNLASADGSGNYYDAAERDFNAGQLQKAFWMLEDEIALNLSNFYVNLAVMHFGNSVVSAKSDINENSKVKVLNIWTAPSETNRYGDIQSQLIYVPDSGMTALLLGLGFLSLAAFRRQLRVATQFSGV